MTDAMLQDYLVGAAERRGNAVALVMGTERSSYSELESASNRVGHLLLEVGCRRGDRVCLLSEKAPQTIVAMLGALKAGCAYVPIDIASPVKRLAEIVASIEPTAVVVSAAGLVILDALRKGEIIAPHLPVIGLDVRPDDASANWFGPDEIDGVSSEPLPRRGDPSDPAQILFTSGSTGRPKGVVVTHASVRAFIEWAVPYFRIASGDRISGHPPLHFDLSTFDLYGALRAEAELHLVPPETVLPRQLAEYILDSSLNQFFCVPSAMTYMTSYGAVPDAGFPTLERVLWCGETLPTWVLIDWMRRVPQARFTNLYGPTETTIASSYYTIPSPPTDEASPIPIGAACDGEELLVLNEALEPRGPGTTGSLYVGGVGLSPGYWRDPAGTAGAFVSDPRPGRDGAKIYRTGDLARIGDDGLVYFLGREDTQIKSRGYRIELSEIEAAISALPAVAECAVLGIPTNGFEGTSICCAYCAKHGSDVAPIAVRGALSATLPAYMIPRHWKPMASLPKTANGKIDRESIRELFTGAQTTNDRSS